MRTREEQIEEIMDKLSEGHPVDIRADMAANIISEAEQRKKKQILDLFAEAKRQADSMFTKQQASMLHAVVDDLSAAIEKLGPCK